MFCFVNVNYPSVSPSLGPQKGRPPPPGPKHVVPAQTHGRSTRHPRLIDYPNSYQLLRIEVKMFVSLPSVKLIPTSYFELKLKCLYRYHL